MKKVIKVPCDCICHRSGMDHIVACCKDGYIEIVIEDEDEMER